MPHSPPVVGIQIRQVVPGIRPGVDIRLVLSVSMKSADITHAVDRFNIFRCAKRLFTIALLSAREQIPEDLAATKGLIAERVLRLPRVAAVSVQISKRPESMQPIDAAAVRINRTRA